MSLRRLFGLGLLFLFFEAIVALVAYLLEVNLLLACAAMTGLALAVWVVIMLVTRRVTAPSATEAPAEPRPPAPRAAPETDDQELTALLRDAADRLAAARVASGGKISPSLATLPLYLVAGLEGAGKTSTLYNSGLEPRLLAGESYREETVVPTKLCNLWFAADSIFADVSGRLFADDPERWERLLRALAGRRETSLFKRLWRGDGPGGNLRGLVLFCDSNAFLRGPDPQKTAALARKLHDRLQSVGAIFGAEFPVYVVFSKSDGIPYFTEFFAHLSEAEDRRIVGATLPFARLDPQAEIYAEAETRRLTGYFNRLYAALADKRLVLLAREEVAGRKAFVYEFPREVKRIRGDLVRFLVDLFRPNPLQPGPKLRGFYFTGVRRVGRSKSIEEQPDEFSVHKSGPEATVFFNPRATAPSVVQPAPARRAAASDPTVPRWAFVSELLQNVVLHDRALPSGAPAHGRLETFRNAALAAAAAALLVTCVLLALAWNRNRELLNDVDATLSAASRTQNAALTPESLQDLEAIRVKLATLLEYEREHTPVKLRWGLYSGNRVLDDVRHAYFERFRKLFLNPMLATLTGRFAQLSPSAPNAAYDDVYNQVKSYRMITSGDCRAQKTPLDRVLPEAWPPLATLSPEMQALANRQIQFYISELVIENPYKAGEETAPLKQAQNYLISFKGPEKLLNGLIERVNREREPALLSKYAPNHEKVLSGPGRVEAAYTRGGWDAIEQRIREKNFASAGEVCVVGAAAAAGAWMPGANSEREIKDLYARRYIDKWKKFLQSEKVIPYHGFQDASEKLGILADNNRSPLLALIFMISRNTNFPTGENTTNKAVQDAATQASKSFVDRIAPSRVKRGVQTVQQIEKAQPAAAPLMTAADIGRAFQPVRAVVNPDSPENLIKDANRTYMASLGEMGDTLKGLAPRPNSSPDPALYQGARGAIDKAMTNVHTMEGAFNNTPEGIDMDLRALVEAPIKNVDPMVSRDPTQPQVEQANKAAGALCGKFNAMARKYPFNPNATEQVTIDELTKFFAPVTGDLWVFRSSPPFATLLSEQGKQWGQNPAVPAPRLTPGFLDAFNRLAAFSNALFPEGSSTPHLAYKVTVSSVSAIQSVTVTADGHTATSSGKAGGPAPFTWPAAGGAAGAKIDVRAGLTLSLASYPGPWGVFQMLQYADGHEGSLFTFNKIRQGRGNPEPAMDTKGEPIVIQVQIDGGPIFQPGYFTRLKCFRPAAQ
jgi:type VI secretion system protein ImpL